MEDITNAIWNMSDFWRSQARAAQNAAIALRRLLRSNDPSLPSEYDGPAWSKIEAEWIEPSAPMIQSVRTPQHPTT